MKNFIFSYYHDKWLEKGGGGGEGWWRVNRVRTTKQCEAFIIKH